MKNLIGKSLYFYERYKEKIEEYELLKESSKKEDHFSSIISNTQSLIKEKEYVLNLNFLIIKMMEILFIENLKKDNKLKDLYHTGMLHVSIENYNNKLRFKKLIKITGGYRTYPEFSFSRENFIEDTTKFLKVMLSGDKLNNSINEMKSDFIYIERMKLLENIEENKNNSIKKVKRI